ncbi:hypothetical protein SEVIR_1G246100v4 [Setaria viridis]
MMVLANAACLRCNSFAGTRILDVDRQTEAGARSFGKGRGASDLQVSPVFRRRRMNREIITLLQSPFADGRMNKLHIDGLRLTPRPLLSLRCLLQVLAKKVAPARHRMPPAERGGVQPSAGARRRRFAGASIRHRGDKIPQHHLLSPPVVPWLAWLSIVGPAQ